MNIKKFVFLFSALTLLFASCSDDDAIVNIEPRGDYENGLLISHEGQFSGGFGTVSFVSNDFSTVENNIFSNINGRTLGTVAQSMAFNGDLAYIIINASNQIEVVNRYTFESVATIDTGLSNPRYMTFANGKGYVTNWGDPYVATDDYLAIVDLTSNSVDNQIISVEEGPEKIVSNGNKLYVAHQGGYSQNNIVSVIDATNNTVSSTIEVGDVPNSLQMDAVGNLWVLSGGKPVYTEDETAGKLSKINTIDNTITSFDFAENQHPNLLNIDNGQVYYYLVGSVYKMGSTALELPANAQLTDLNLYAMTVKNETVYGVDAGGFTSNGSLKVYNLDSNTPIETITVGLIPNGVYFN